jgi:hypothetical protein
MNVFKCGAGEGRKSVGLRVKNKAILRRVKEERNIPNTIKRRKANCFVISCAGTVFWNTLLGESYTGWEDDEEGVSTYCKISKKEKVLEFERGITSSHSLENLLWKRLWKCRKADYIMTGLILEYNHYHYHSCYSWRWARYTSYLWSPGFESRPKHQPFLPKIFAVPLCNYWDKALALSSASLCTICFNTKSYAFLQQTAFICSWFLQLRAIITLTLPGGSV